MLQTDAQLNAITLLEGLQRRDPGQWGTSVLRTLQRRMRLWRAKSGHEPEVYLAQEHPPGRQGISDFTVADELKVQNCRRGVDSPPVPICTGLFGMDATLRSSTPARALWRCLPVCTLRGGRRAAFQKNTVPTVCLQPSTTWLNKRS